MSNDNNIKSDTELDDILSNALEDFDKPNEREKINVKKQSKKKNKEEQWSDEYMKNAAAEFEKNLQTLLKDDPEQEDYSPEKLTEHLQNFIKIGDGDENQQAPEDFTDLISETIKNLSDLGNEVENQDIPNILNNEDPENCDFFPLMQQVMESLLSKEILYPALKDMLNKYPKWLEEKRSSLEDSEFERYQKQLDLMKLVCEELDKESSDDTENIKKERFQNILDLMLKMQECGQPPQELMSENNSPFNFNALNGLNGLNGLNENLNNCSVM